MENSPLYNEALQNIGRNVVALQRMEHMLKTLLASIDLEGHLSELTTRIAEAHESVSKRTMGTVVGELLDKIFSEPIEDPVRSSVRGETWISSQYRIGGSDEYIEGIKRSFKVIVEERNQLIHHRLLTLDPRSNDSCRELISYLDDQRDRIEPMFEFLKETAKGIVEMWSIAEQIRRQTSTDSQDRSVGPSTVG